MVHRKQAWSKRVKRERHKKKYLTRMQATRLLQVDSHQFRRMCILKGIYPRALNRSKQKQSGNEKQYYLAKEIKWLVRDHIAEKIFAYRAWEKKVRRAQAMQRIEDLKTLQSDKVKPKYNLVASIKERYPFFIDAVRDVDDAISLISLYAFLSPEVMSDSTIELHHALPSGLHEKAKQICEDWASYVRRAQVLTKGFISIKGYYYEAYVKGERIRWLSPHEYAHKFPSGVQQFILITFLEFYVEMMRFVLFKLNQELTRDLEERRIAEEEAEDAITSSVATDALRSATSGTLAIALSSSAGAMTEDFRVDADELDVDNKQKHSRALREEAASTKSKAALIDEELQTIRRLFDGLTFFISREVPAKHVAFVIEACGGRVATEYVPANLTHVIIDRPALPPALGDRKEDHIEYVQPQYVFDCLNARFLLPAYGYRMGEELPPHVSPFTVSISNSTVDNMLVEDAKKKHPKIVSYVPDRVHEIRRLIDPSYTKIDPEGKLLKELREQEEAGDYSSGDEHVAVPEMDADDDVQLSDDELKVARKRPAWEDEQVTENVERSALSAFKVKKQRELNLANKPTSDVVALRRQQQRRLREERNKSETFESRLKRKAAEAKKEERTQRNMQLQVARKKAARYYKMISGVVEGTKKKAQILETKAKQVQEGKIKPSADGKVMTNRRVEAKRQRAQARGGKAATEANKKPKVANPYRNLPKWVR